MNDKDRIKILEKENERLDEENRNLRTIISRWKEEDAGSKKDPAPKGV